MHIWYVHIYISKELKREGRSHNWQEVGKLFQLERIWDIKKHSRQTKKEVGPLWSHKSVCVCVSLKRWQFQNTSILLKGWVGMTVRQETESRSDSYPYLGGKGTEGSDTFSGVQENAKMVASLWHCSNSQPECFQVFILWWISLKRTLIFGCTCYMGISFQSKIKDSQKHLTYNLLNPVQFYLFVCLFILLRTPQIIYVLPTYSVAHGQTPSGKPLKENWFLPLPNPHQKPSAVKSYTPTSLSHF